MRKIFLLLLVLAAWLPGYRAQAQLNKGYFFYAGRSFLIESKYRDAIEVLNILLRADSTAYEGYFLRGIAKYNLDDLIGADQDFSEAIRKNPVFTTAFQYRAITQLRRRAARFSGSDRPASRSAGALLQPGRHLPAEPAVREGDRRFQYVYPL